MFVVRLQPPNKQFLLFSRSAGVCCDFCSHYLLMAPPPPLSSLSSSILDAARTRLRRTLTRLAWTRDSSSGYIHRANIMWHMGRCSWHYYREREYSVCVCVAWSSCSTLTVSGAMWFAVRAAPGTTIDISANSSSSSIDGCSPGFALWWAVATRLPAAVAAAPGRGPGSTALERSLCQCLGARPRILHSLFGFL